MSRSACVVVAIMFDVIVNFKIVLFSFLTSFEFAIDRPSVIVLSDFVDKDYFSII